MKLKLLLYLALITAKLNSSPFDIYYIYSAYDSYQKNDFNKTIEAIYKIENISLQSQMLLANSFYRVGSLKKALHSYQSIKSTDIKTKQQIYYNIANCYFRLQKYKEAKKFYIKTLQLGDDSDAKYNLALLIFLDDKKDFIGIAHPKSQSSSSSKSVGEQKDSKDKKRDEDNPSSGGSGDGESSKEKEKKDRVIAEEESPQKHPLSSKLYELINRGYIYEKEPW